MKVLQTPTGLFAAVFRFCFALVFIVLVFPMSSLAENFPAISVPELFSSVSVKTADLISTNDSPHIIKKRSARVDFSALAQQSHAGALFRLNLFQEVSLLAKVTNVISRGSNDYTVFGELAGNGSSDFMLSVKGQAMVMNAQTSDGAYDVRYLCDGTHEIRQVDVSKLGHCGVVEEQTRKTPNGRIKGREQMTFSGNIEGVEYALVDVMVLYTPSVWSDAGGTESVEAVINYEIDRANVMYANSGLNARLRLAHQGMIGYSEHGGDLTTDLNRLTAKSDGYVDEVHSLRDKHHADLVCLWVSPGGWGVRPGGIAHIMRSLSGSFESSAFSVVDYAATVSSRTFAHELGHNMGCAHDRDSAPSGGLYNYSYGWRFYGNSGTEWRTVMAYTPGRSIGYFSNPNISYDGVATGTDRANNALTINNSCWTVAEFRKVPPKVITQPQSQEVPAGTAARFSVAATGNTPMSYQWRFNGANIANGTTSVLTLSDARPVNAGTYTVVVSNPIGTVTSAKAVLKVLTTPAIITQPETRAASLGSTITLAVKATGGVPLAYKWHFNGSAISGATKSGLTLSSVTFGHAGSYSVVITNQYGSVTSATAILSIGNRPVITTQPKKQTIRRGGDATFTVSASGTAPLRYNWRLNGSIINGATNSMLQLANVSRYYSPYYYDVVVSNTFGNATSRNITLSVGDPPSIELQQDQSQPDQVAAVSGQKAAPLTALVSSEADGYLDPAPTFEWYFNGALHGYGATQRAAYGDWDKDGYESYAPSISPIQMNHSGYYRAIARDLYGSATSMVCKVTVKPAGAKHWWRAGRYSNTTPVDFLTDSLSAFELRNELLRVPNRISGIEGDAFGMDGTNDYLYGLYNYRTIPGTESFTFEAWFKTSGVLAPSEAGMIASFYDAAISNDGASLWQFCVLTNGRLKITLADAMGAHQTLTGTTNVTNNSWHHAVVVRDTAARKLSLYVDGKENTNATLTVLGGILDEGEEDRFTIGAAVSAGTGQNSFFRGSLDELVYYDRALTAAEIKQSYNSTLPPPPGGVTAIPVKTNVITLRWSSATPNVKSFIIWRGTSASSISTKVAALPGYARTFTDSGLALATTYYYWVQAITSAASSPKSIVSVTTLDVPPSTPTELLANAFAPNAVGLSWRPTSKNASGFALLRKLSGGTYAHLINVTGAATNYVDRAVHSGLTYYYVVQAYNSGGSSHASSAARVTLPTELGDNLLFQNTNGQFSIWVMNGTNFVRSAPGFKGPAANTGWRIAAFADFNSDYNADILWQNNNGHLSTWFMRGTNYLRSIPLRMGYAASTGWKVVGAPDLTGDGKPDLLWHHNKGTNLCWQMNGTNYIKQIPLRAGSAMTTGWNIVSTADLDGNSSPDFIWSNTNGMNSVWLMNRTNYIKSVPLRTGNSSATGWKLSAFMDLNADRKTDFIWEKKDGRLEGWLMNGTNYIRSVTLRTNAAASSGWRLVGPK